MSPVSSFMEICSIGTALMHVERWTDMVKLVGSYHNYANVDKN